MHTFETLGLGANIIRALTELGYESPFPVQEQCIIPLLEGNDLLAQAQTGSGKTGAFALPILSKLDLSIKNPQAIVLAPTRELAIQVAESFLSYAKYIPNFHVLPIYGGQNYRPQLSALDRGVHVVVGTPGRVMDHLRRGTLSMESLKMLVLDEADEMLKMGFIDDVEWILQQIPNKPQTALFSATMPESIRKIANKYLKEPTKVHLNSKETTVSSIEQFYSVIPRAQKIEALTRFLEVEDVDGMIVFTRTIVATLEVAEKLGARGFAVEAINGDMKQDARERVIKRIKNGQINIIVATEVAARGLDVERLSHVVNYDIPYDVESYVHRIGRTGRAGRVGKALSFIEPREGRMLKDIERALKQQLKVITPPSIAQLQEKRVANFTSQIVETLTKQDLDTYRSLVETIAHTSEASVHDIAAALVYLLQKDKLVKSAQEAESFTAALEEEKKKSYRRSGGGERGRSYGAGGNDRRPARSSEGERRPRPAYSGDRPKAAEGAEKRPRKAYNDKPIAPAGAASKGKKFDSAPAGAKRSSKPSFSKSSSFKPSASKAGSSKSGSTDGRRGSR